MVSDPAGMLVRIPELVPLLGDEGVRRAVERCDPHRLYRRLFWANLFGKLPAHRKTIQLLLARRRLFLAPITSAPRLATINGVGVRVYGQAEADPNDGTYILTHYIVLFLIPIFPLRQFLVRDGAPSGGRPSWGFIGKVPLSPVEFFWNRLVALAVAALVIGGAASAFIASRYHAVHLVNA